MQKLLDPEMGGGRPILEGFWSRLKASIRSMHVNVSAKHLPKYLGEFE